jgi:hypothetical protein
MEYRNAEDGEHRVSDEFLNCPAMALDGCPHRVEIADHDSANSFSINSFSDCGRARHVAEEKGRDLAPLAGGRLRQL